MFYKLIFFFLHFPTFSPGQYFPALLPCEKRNGRSLAAPKRLLHGGPQLGVTQPAISMRLRAMGKSSSTITHHRTLQKWSKTTWRHSSRRCYSMLLIHQTCPLLTTTCFRRWVTRSLCSTSILKKMSKNGFLSGLPRKRRNVFCVVSTHCPRDGKNV